MAPRSKIKTDLSDQARAELDKRLAAGRHSLDDLVGWLDELGFKISRSSLHRYSQDFEDMAADIRLTREMSKAVGRELEDLADGDATPMLVESLHALLVKSRKQLVDSGDITPKAVADLARAVKDLSSALGQRAAMEMRIRSEAEKRTKAEAAKAVETVAKERGLSAETVAAFKAGILGVKLSAGPA
jgi:hypothetical protein